MQQLQWQTNNSIALIPANCQHGPPKHSPRRARGLFGFTKVLDSHGDVSDSCITSFLPTGSRLSGYSGLLACADFCRTSLGKQALTLFMRVYVRPLWLFRELLKV